MKQHLLAASLFCALALAPRAYAAIGDQSLDPAANNGTADQSDDAAAKPVAPPSPTPGSKTTAPAAAAAANGKTLGPNEALFDAISRGDLTAARDAVARGADLNAENSLGQKPADASIDLGRNDITFMLLAQRPLIAASADIVPAAPAKTPFPGATRLARATRATVSRPPVRQVAETRAANDPGTPQPAVGFLGF